MAFTPVQLRQARIALTIAFVGNGFLSGAMVARIADIKSALHLSDAGLGTALLLCSITSFLAMAPVSRLVSRLGSGPTTVVGMVSYVVAFPLVGLASSVGTLCVAFVAYGVALTIYEVAMNSHAVALEHVYGRRIMTVQHATWSLGQLVGVALGGLLSQVHYSVFLNFLLTSAAVVAIGWMVRRWLLPADVDRHEAKYGVPRARRRLSMRHLPYFFVALGFLGLFEQVGEGAAGTWGVVLARNSYHAAPLLSTIPYVLFAAVMVAGRLVGDRLAAAFSTQSILVVSGSCIAVGLGVGMVMNTFSGEILAWVLLGVGSSNVIPLLFSAAGRAALSREGSTLRPSGAIALVTAIAYSGSLVGPPAIGYLADIFALHWALILPAVLGGVMAIGVPFVLRRGDDVVANPAAESA